MRMPRANKPLKFRMAICRLRLTSLAFFNFTCAGYFVVKSVSLSTWQSSGDPYQYPSI